MYKKSIMMKKHKYHAREILTYSLIKKECDFIFNFAIVNIGFAIQPFLIGWRAATWQVDTAHGKYILCNCL